MKPVLVCEVTFGEWTREGRIRHPVFQGLRSDKPAAADPARAAPSRPRPRAARRRRPRKRTRRSPLRRCASPNAERVIDTDSGITKGELVAFYEQARPLMLPHLKGRPVSLVRAPEGIGGELFFQKHAQRSEHAGREAARPVARPRSRSAAADRHRARAAVGGADERDRVPHLERDVEARSTRPTA